MQNCYPVESNTRCFNRELLRIYLILFQTCTNSLSLSPTRPHSRRLKPQEKSVRRAKCFYGNENLQHYMLFFCLFSLNKHYQKFIFNAHYITSINQSYKGINPQKDEHFALSHTLVSK